MAKAFEFYPSIENYKEYASHGYEFLKDYMWDNEFGGFLQLVDSTGKTPEGAYMLEKRAYGNSFGIYALAAYYKLSKDPEEKIVNRKSFFENNNYYKIRVYGVLAMMIYSLAYIIEPD